MHVHVHVHVHMKAADTSAGRSSSGRPLAAAGAARQLSAGQPVRSGGTPSGWKAAVLPPQLDTVVRAWCLALDRPPSARRRRAGCRSSCCRLTASTWVEVVVVALLLPLASRWPEGYRPSGSAAGGASIPTC